MVEIGWTDRTLQDIENIAAFISKDSEYYANIQVSRFFAIVKILETNPQTGRIVPEINRNSIRELIQGNYRIIYRVLSVSRIDITTLLITTKI